MPTSLPPTPPPSAPGSEPFSKSPPAPHPETPDPLIERGYLGHPDPGEKPIGFLRMMVILLSSHIGVRSRANREEDFRRANGLHMFVAAVVYFVLVVGVLVALVNTISR